MKMIAGNFVCGENLGDKNLSITNVKASLY